MTIVYLPMLKVQTGLTMTKNHPLLMMTGVFLFLFSQAGAGASRWYDASLVDRGQSLYQQHCAECHGLKGDSKDNWQQDSGAGSAPPLDGSANSWHYSLKQLRLKVRKGSVQLGGSMPGFEGNLTAPEIDAVIAYFQSLWPAGIYDKWAERFPAAGRQLVRNEAESAGMTRFLRMRLGSNDFTPPQPTAIPGIYQTSFGNKFAYLTGDGRYIFIGDLIDLEKGQNLTELGRSEVARAALAAVPSSDFVVYPASTTEKTVLNVFTDTSCSYCRKLHQEVGFLQAAGISVRYLPFPRGGNRGPGYQDLKKVWCSPDPLQAMNIAKEVAQGELSDADCARATIVDKGFELGKQLGISGTPALFSARGTKFAGYVNYRELIPRLLGEL